MCEKIEYVLDKITFVYDDVSGEALPDTETVKKFLQWRKDISESEVYTSISLYYLDFINDVIGELEYQRDILEREEKDNFNKPLPRYLWEKQVESSYTILPKWFYNKSECDRQYADYCRVHNRNNRNKENS
tara:strand:+ start:938 stop:1330 length:393 start_codon:yes stop_codon:yes gene_type:complete